MKPLFLPPPTLKKRLGFPLHVIKSNFGFQKKLHQSQDYLVVKMSEVVPEASLEEGECSSEDELAGYTPIERPTDLNRRPQHHQPIQGRHHGYLLVS